MAVQAQFQLGVSPDWIDGGCGGGGGGGGNGGGFNQMYYSYLQQQQQKQQQCNNLQFLQNYQMKNNQSLGFDYNFQINNFKNQIPSTPFNSQFSAYDDKQSQEIDHFIISQNEKLRLFLQEQRKQQMETMEKRIESKIMPILKQKDEEISQEIKRRMELEEFLKRLESENLAWQRIAQENESIIISLNNTIDQIKEQKELEINNNNGIGIGGEAEDAESCCDTNREIIDEDEDTNQNGKMKCKNCKTRNSCVLFLPCRHLSSCNICEKFLDYCPVCQTVKRTTIEALIV